MWAGELGLNSLDHQGVSQYCNWVALPQQEGHAVMPDVPALTMIWLASEGDGAPEPWLPLGSEIDKALHEGWDQRRAGAVAAATERKEAAGKRRRAEEAEREAREQQPATPWRS